jgi:hypothetical protein
MSITIPVDSVIRFLNAKTILPAEIHHRLVEVCEEGAMNEGNVRKRDVDLRLTSPRI